ncbi:MAG: aldo/keto reductase [Gemmatimonadota bacterium]|nr:aldo/keto reductase [Gemmatimonadota bacterium]
MRAIPIGPGAPAVSVVGYGGMHISIVERPPEADGIRAVHAALDAGMTLIDTADVYCLDHTDIGHNERLIAKALRSWSGPRERILVATKGGLTRPHGSWERDASPGHLRAACDASLRALRVEQIALYQLHAPDPAVPLEESVGTLADLQREGKIRWVGLSNVSVDEIRRAEAIVPVVSVQNRLNPWFREALTGGVVRYCGERGIGFLAYSPTGGGRLTKKIPAHPVLSEIGRRLGVSSHQVCLAWVLAQGPTVIVIPSGRRVEHVRDSAAAGQLVLDRGDLDALTAASFDRA